MTNPIPESWRDWRAWSGLRPFQHHGRVLLLAGAIYIIMGLQYLFIPLTPDRRAGLEVALWFSGGSAAPWGGAYMLIGLLAMASSRWPRFSKLWGYTALAGLAGAWLFQYLTGLIFLHIPFGPGLSGTCAWAIITLFWVSIAGLVNPDDLLNHPPPPASAGG